MVTSAERRSVSLSNDDPDRPLHAWPDHVNVDESDYWACDRPEQPAETGIWWDERCPRCQIAYEAARALQPEMGVWHLGRLIPLAQVSWEQLLRSPRGGGHNQGDE